MTTNNTSRSTNYKGEKELAFQRDYEYSNSHGREQSDSGAGITFTRQKDKLRIEFGYKSSEAEKWFGRGMSINLEQALELKQFLEEHFDDLHLKNHYTYVLLYGELLQQDFIDSFFADYKYVCKTFITNTSFFKYKDEGMPDIIGLGNLKDSIVLGSVYKISLFDKRKLDNSMYAGTYLSNKNAEYLSYLDKVGNIKDGEDYVTVSFFEYNIKPNRVRSILRTLTDGEKARFREIYRKAYFPEERIAEMLK